MLRLISFKIISILIGASLFLNCESFAFAGSLRTAREEYPIDAANISDWLRNQRIVQQKNDLEALAQQNNSGERRVGAQVSSQSLEVLPLIGAQNLTPPAIAPDPAAIHQWLTQNEDQSPLGLLVSYPDNAVLNQQAFTYDQAVAGSVLLKEGDTQAAKKIFDFYSGQWDGTGFWTVYNTQSADGNKIEYLKIMGPSAWIGIFSAFYYQKTGDAKGLELATQIGQWIQALPHAEGGVAMGVNDFAGQPNWGAIFSTENNLDYYALADFLSTEATDPFIRTSFQNEKQNLEGWFKTQVLNPITQMFQRGMSDSFQSLDTNSWAILVFGAQGLKDQFGIDVDMLVARSEAVFSVQSDGSFGGDPLSAKGFDFSDSVNASSIGRSGVNWVEGTNQMISVYSLLNQYYSQGSNADPSRVAYYQTRKDYFTAKNSENTVSQNGALGYLYADPSDEQVFYDNPSWKASGGQSVASTAWAYFALKGINPFDLRPSDPSSNFSAFDSSASTGNNGQNNLFLHVAADKQAVVNWEGRSFQGVFDDTDLSIIIAETQNPGLGYKESWRVDLNDPSQGLQISSFNSESIYDDGSKYQHQYQFNNQGLLQTQSLDQSLAGGTVSNDLSYGYIQTSDKTLLDSVDTVTFFDGLYGYGSRFAYEYDNLGALLSITVTQETRNDPLFRVLESYKLIFDPQGAVQIQYLDKQILPFA